MANTKRNIDFDKAGTQIEMAHLHKQLILKEEFAFEFAVAECERDITVVRVNSATVHTRTVPQSIDLFTNRLLPISY